MNDDEIQVRLGSMARATLDVRTSPGFTDRVMLTVLAIDDGFWALVTRLGRRAVLSFTLAALVALASAFFVRGALDRALAADLVELEVEW